MSEILPPEIIELIQKYPIESFFTKGSLNRELGRRVIAEISALQSPNPDQDTSPIAAAGAFTSLSANFSPSEGIENTLVFGVDPDMNPEAQLRKRYADLLVIAIASTIEKEQPTAPVSRELKLQPAAPLDIQRQMTHYFGYLKARQGAVYEHMNQGVEQLGEPLYAIDNLRAIVAIPVAGHQEQRNIYHTLTQWARQNLSPEEFEVILGVNLPLQATDQKSSPQEMALAKSLKETLGEIRRFKADYPQITTRFYTHAYEGTPPPIGKIRADLWGSMALDLQNRGLDHDILVVSSDADTVHLNRDYLSNMANTFEAKRVDIVTAKLLWQRIPGLPYNAVANRFLRYQTFLDDVRDNAGPHLLTSDANTGVSLATYLAVGGFDRTAKLGEMNDLTYDIRGYRSRGSLAPSQIEAKALGARLRSHSRRLILAMALGHSPYDAWDQNLIEFGPNDPLRTEAFRSQEAETQAQRHWPQWIEEITPHYTKNLDGTKRERVVRLARQLLGFA